MNDHPFYVLKLETGETLFAEVIEKAEYSLVVRNPVIVKTLSIAPGKDGFYLELWNPFTEDEYHNIPIDLCYNLKHLSDSYVKHYGKFLMQNELQKLGVAGAMKVGGGMGYFDVLKDVSTKAEELGESYAIKFGIKPDAERISKEDLSEDRVLH